MILRYFSAVILIITQKGSNLNQNLVVKKKKKKKNQSKDEIFSNYFKLIPYTIIKVIILILLKHINTFYLQMEIVLIN